MPSTKTILDIADYARTIPACVPVLGVGGVSNQPALGIAQDTIRKILSPSLPWKWNRFQLATVNFVALQQDYVQVPAVTTLGWLESASLIQTVTTPNVVPPTRHVECVRDLARADQQGIPTRVCWIAAGNAVCGTWAASTAIASSAGQQRLPASAFSQIKDSNGNIQVATTFGTTGTVQPTWNTAVGGTTADGTVVWTMADPNSVAIRFDYVFMPGANAFTADVNYQGAVPVYTSLSNTLGIPDNMQSVFTAGFVAKCLENAGDPSWVNRTKLFEQSLQESLGAADREPSTWRFVPDIGLLS